MPNSSTSHRALLVRRLLLAILLVVGAGALGLWVGRVSVPNDMPEYGTIIGGGVHQAKPTRVTDADLQAPLPPVFFHAAPTSADHWGVVLEEVRMAAAAGVHQVIVPATLDWSGERGYNELLGQLKALTEINPRIRVFLQLSLDPSEEWATTRATEALRTKPEDGPMAAPYSALWRDEAARRASDLARQLAGEKIGRHVRGYLLAALEEGRWEIPADAGPSASASDAFREWLRRRYTDNDALRKAWGSEIASLEVATVPEVAAAAPEQTFLQLPAQQNVVDYREFVSDSCADAIAEIMVKIKQAVGQTMPVFAVYGHTFDATPGGLGAHGMGRLLYSDLDGFVGAVSSSDRGIGGAGGLNGPAFSPTLHQKQWLTLDRTRTGVERDPATGEIQRMQGIRADDVFNVQRRNFAQAAVLGVGIAWSDPLGEGWLHDEAQWVELGRLADAYDDLYPLAVANAAGAPSAGGPAASSESQKQPSDKDAKKQEASDKPKSAEAVPAESAPAAENAAATPGAPIPSFDQALEAMLTPAPVGPPNTFNGGLMVVVDESTMHLAGNATLLRDRVMLPAREAALRGGTPVRLCLLQDLLDDIAPAAEVYLFTNACRLNEAERQRLHARLQRDRACAIWCYAPGYFGPAAGVENIAKTVGMKVLAMKSPAQAGSTFSLAGRWVAESAEIGETAPVEPLFYIDDPDADTLARYRAGQQGSIALRVLPEGWTSIYVAEPAMTPGLLRELLHIIEKRSCFRDASREHYDAAFVGLNLVGIHARQGGEISISLGNVFDIQDAFDPSMGWPQKESITIPVKTGETRLLRLTPVY